MKKLMDFIILNILINNETGKCGIFIIQTEHSLNDMNYAILQIYFSMTCS